jgi:hypothetical protein
MRPCKRHRIQVHPTWKAHAERIYRTFQQIIPRGRTGRLCVPKPRRGKGANGQLVTRLQPLPPARCPWRHSLRYVQKPIAGAGFRAGPEWNSGPALKNNLSFDSYAYF